MAKKLVKGRKTAAKGKAKAGRKAAPAAKSRSSAS